MTGKPYIIALDQGTSGCRAVAVDRWGKAVIQHRVALAPVRPAEGISQYEAHALLSAQLTALHAVLQQVGAEHVAALAVCSQRSSVVLWNAQTGQAVAPVLTWEDGRAAKQAAQADIGQDQVHTLTGLYKTPYFSAPKIAWAMQELADVKQTLDAGVLCAAPVASFLIWHLTAGTCFATDFTLAQRMLLLDIHTRTWSKTLCNAFGIPGQILPQLKPSAADYGVYQYQGQRIPVYACVGDQQAAAVYQHIAVGQSAVNYGTGAFWLYHAGAQQVLLPGLLTSLSADGAYLLEGPVNAAGSALVWLKAQGVAFGQEDVQPLCETSQAPVLFLPALGGLGAPYWDFSTKAAAENLTPRTRKEDWVAGVVRGIGYLIADIEHYARQNALRVNGPVIASGGLSHLAYLMQFQADLLQRELAVVPEADATVLGTAKLAARQAGWDVSAWTADEPTRFYPRLPADEATQLYSAWQAFVARHRN